MRCFEKVNFDEFSKYYGDNKELYEEYSLPKRMTSASAGYDFFAIEDFVIKPGEIKKIATGYKARYENDEVLFIIVRGSVGFKYNVRITNQVVVIDADYYNNTTNNGQMFISLQNEGDKDFVVKKGEGYVQGIFMKYLTCDNDVADGIRNDGFGSTNKRKDD